MKFLMVGAFKPVTAVQWLIAYLPRVKTIYAFHVLIEVDRDDGWRELWAVKDKLWSQLGGILQQTAKVFRTRPISDRLAILRTGLGAVGGWGLSSKMVRGRTFKWNSETARSENSS